MRSIPLWIRLLGGIALLAAACVGLAFVPTNDVAYAPTPPFDLEGKVTIDGRRVEPLQGRLYMVGVTERRVNLLQRVLLDVTDPDVDFGKAPKLPKGTKPKDGPNAADVRGMADAKVVAAGVALDLAGERVDWGGAGATVTDLEEGTPAARVLRPGDIIVQVNGRAVRSSVEVIRAIQGLPGRSKVRLGVQRAGTPMVPTITTMPVEGEPGRTSRIGAALETISPKIGLPRTVRIDSDAVVGPSAGLAFALYLFDAVDRTDLLGGRHVVATGALAPDGQVLPVGRIRQKAVAAQEANRDLFVVPRANAREAEAAVRSACDTAGDCLQVVPVRDVLEATRLLALDPAGLRAHLDLD